MNSAPIIFIVDDDEAVRHSLQALLEAAGHRIEMFPSGEAFFDAPSAGACILLDLHLPGLDGIQVIQRLRAQGASTPVILISGRFDAGTRARAADAGATALLEKPLREHRLLESIERALALDAAPAGA